MPGSSFSTASVRQGDIAPVYFWPGLPRQNQSVRSSILTNLVSYWKLEEASGTRVDELGANSMSAVNTPGNAAGKSNNALALVAASNQYVQKTSAAGLPGTTDHWSWSAWVYLATTTSFRAMFNCGGSGDQKVSLIFNTGSSVPQRWSGFSFLNSISLSTWTHIAYTFESTGTNTGTERGYINGAETNSRTGAVPAPAGTTLVIGNRSTADMPYDGRLDEIGFWVGRTLSLADVQQLYNSGSGLFYPFS